MLAYVTKHNINWQKNGWSVTKVDICHTFLSKT